MVCAEDIHRDVQLTIADGTSVVGGTDDIVNAEAIPAGAAAAEAAAGGAVDAPPDNDYMQNAKAKAAASKVEDRMKRAFVESNFLSSYIGMLDFGLRLAPTVGPASFPSRVPAAVPQPLPHSCLLYTSPSPRDRG